MRTALITGVTGQDGGYLAERLVSDGVHVHGTVRPGVRPPPHLTVLGDALELHEVAASDGAGLREVVRAATPDEVYNLVGVSSVVRSWRDPVLTGQVNGLFVAQLLELLWEQQSRTGRQVRVVQASSAEIFAGAGQVPQDESTPLTPRSPYGASKAYAHCLVQVFRDRGMHASNAVLYNHESPRRPPAFVTRKITMTVAAIAAGQASELVLGNLEARRDWGWAPEYVAALVLAARNETPGDHVIATGTSHSVREFATAALAHAGLEVTQDRLRVSEDLVRPYDPVPLVGRPDRARDLLGWSPTVLFEDVVARMVEADLSLVGITV